MLGLVYQQMHVLRHDHITGDNKAIARADPLQRIFKQFHGGDRGQLRAAPIATEGEEVELACLLITDALAFHAPREYSNRESGCSDK
jgi:hypothetical protein